ncbi:MAG: helix-turn-helix domain-containing protein [Thermodesulfobacteriota bacterium]
MPPLRERRYIDHVLQQTGGSRKKAAGILGISISTFWRRLNARP